MKICLISDRLPWPPNDGRRSTLFSFCKLLKQNHKHEICLITFENNRTAIAQKPFFIDHVHVVFKPTMFELAWNTPATLLFKKKSLQSLLFFSKKTAKKIMEITEREQPDAVIFNMSRTAQYYSYVKTKKIIFDMDDLLSQRYKGMLDKNETENILGNFGTPLFGKFSKILNKKAFGKFLLNTEYKLLQKEETKLIRYTDATVLVNGDEAKQLSEKLQNSKIIHIPNRTDTTYFNPESVQEISKHQPSLVFHGTLSQPHNFQAISILTRDILPLIKNEVPHVHCYIVGNTKNIPISQFMLNEKNLSFTGYVEDIRCWLKGTSVYVCPIVSGSGIKTKILEAMSMQIPIVTSPEGASGLPLVDDKHCLIRKNPIDFAQAVVELLRNENKRSSLALNARNLAKNSFDENKIIKLWNDLIETEL